LRKSKRLLELKKRALEKKKVQEAKRERENAEEKARTKRKRKEEKDSSRKKRKIPVPLKVSSSESEREPSPKKKVSRIKKKRSLRRGRRNRKRSQNVIDLTHDSDTEEEIHYRPPWKKMKKEPQRTFSEDSGVAFTEDEEETEGMPYIAFPMSQAYFVMYDRDTKAFSSNRKLKNGEYAVLSINDHGGEELELFREEFEEKTITTDLENKALGIIEVKRVSFLEAKQMGKPFINNHHHYQIVQKYYRKATKNGKVFKVKNCEKTRKYTRGGYEIIDQKVIAELKKVREKYLRKKREKPEIKEETNFEIKKDEDPFEFPPPQKVPKKQKRTKSFSHEENRSFVKAYNQYRHLKGNNIADGIWVSVRRTLLRSGIFKHVPTNIQLKDRWRNLERFRRVEKSKDGSFKYVKEPRQKGG